MIQMRGASRTSQYQESAPMPLDLSRIDDSALAAAAKEYNQKGFLLLTGASDIAGRLADQIAGRIGADGPTLSSMLDPDKPVVFAPELRQRLSRIDTSRELAVWLVKALEPVLADLLGPFAHVSSTFHGQFKGGGTIEVSHGGYAPETSFMEVHGAYLLHQDFAGASIPTSPSAITLWVPLNSCGDWNLRLFPGSHRQGLLSSEWLTLDDSRLSALDKPVDVAAAEGTAVLFNAMLLHGTSNPGPRRRVSADIRFFPLCGFLPSEVHFVGDDPLRALGDRLTVAEGDTLRAPLLEDRLFLGGEVDAQDAPPHSVLNWVNYVRGLTRGEGAKALPHLERFANVEFDPSGPATYAERFHDRPISANTLRAVRERLSTLSPDAPELDDLDRLLARLAS
jgi:hypothetical protein